MLLFLLASSLVCFFWLFLRSASSRCFFSLSLCYSVSQAVIVLSASVVAVSSTLSYLLLSSLVKEPPWAALSLCPTGVEPATFGSGGRRSIQLSYGHKCGNFP
jgi:hypothetical protein